MGFSSLSGSKSKSAVFDEEGVEGGGSGRKIFAEIIAIRGDIT